MANGPRVALDRIFPAKSLYTGPALLGFGYSVAAALLMYLVLVVGVLLVDLFVTGGELPESLAATATETFAVPDPLDDSEDAGTVTADWAKAGPDRGLVPTALRFEEAGSSAAPVVASLVRNVSGLRTNSSAVVLLLLTAVGLLVARAILLRLARGTCRKLAVATTTRLRRSLHRHALRLGPSDLRNRGGDTVLGHFTDDVNIVGEFILEWTYRLGRSPVEILVLFVLTLGISPLLTLQCLIPLGGCWYLVHREMVRREASRKLGLDRARDDLVRLAESLHNTRVVRGYGMENYEHEEFGKHLEHYQRKLLNVERGEATSHWAVRVLVAATLGLVLFLVGLKIVSPMHDLSLAGATALLVAFGWMYGPLEVLCALPEKRRRAAVAADGIQRYLDELPEVSQAVGAKFLQPLAEQLRFEGVTYHTHTGETLLQDFNCAIRAGDVVALVSLDPVPARAVAYLLPRFIEPRTGRILIDGEDIAWVTLESLRAETIFIGAGDVFFTGSVFDNIACGQPDLKLPEVTEAAKVAHAHNFIQKLPAGYETILGEHGEQLDPGQAFRLGLARAIVRNPALLIIEEPDAKLDKDTKALVDDAYDRILPDRTVILLPTRLTTLRRARRVIVVHDGKVVADGHHDDLVKSSAVYRHWEYSHFNEFERRT